MARKPKGEALTTRKTLLDAATQIILQRGVGALTLEAVAQAAGVSKGGLLYHFPSKEALIIGLLDADFDHFEAEIVAHIEAQGEVGQPGAWVRAYLAISLADNELSNSFGAGALAAIATTPALLGHVQQRFVRWQALATTDGIDPAVATLMRVAADGLFFLDLLQFAPPDPTLRQQIVDRLFELSR
jgi:AcrR family transcriptional regulator